MTERASIVVAAVLAGLAASAADEPVRTDPLDVGQEERVEVRLALVDVVVLDREDRTVPGLGIEDFEVVLAGERRPIDTLDVACTASLDDPAAARHPGRRAPVAPGVARRVVLALDYLHLTQVQRVAVLEQAREMIRHGLGPEEQVMLAALNGGLRVEQPFTSDRERLLAALERMEYDITLWEPTFAHLTEMPFFAGLRALFAILDPFPGRKAIVLFSESDASTDENDAHYAELAALAAASRCAIYPVSAAMLNAKSPG